MIHDTEVAVAPHVRFCFVEDQVIVLDLRSNRYAGIAGSRFPALAGLLGHSASGEMTGSADSLETLKARGWLVESSSPPSPPSIEARLPEAMETLFPRVPARPLLSMRAHAWHCLRSAISASWRLRRRSLLAIAQGVAEREHELREHRAAPSHQELVDAVSAYLHLRPLFFSARDRCLHDSLTLVTFLAALGIPARWMIGVRIRPFAAHSWVQHESLVLNDAHERVRAYRPILVV